MKLDMKYWKMPYFRGVTGPACNLRELLVLLLTCCAARYYYKEFLTAKCAGNVKERGPISG